MKKIIAILIMAMLFIGVLPFALATEGKDGKNLKLPKTGLEVRSEIKGEMKNKAKVNLENLDEIKNELKGRREIKKDVDILKLNKDLKVCKNKNDEDCKKIKIQFKLGAKEYMENAVKKMMLLLEKAQKNIEDNTNLSAEVKTDLKIRITKNKESLISTQENLKALNEDSTKEELKTAKMKLKESRLEAHKTLKYVASILREKRTGLIIQRADNLQIRLDKIVNKLKTQETDISFLEEKIEDFNEKIESANTKRQASLNIITTIKSDGKLSVEEKIEFNKSHELLVDAHKELKEAHLILKEIVKLIKEQREGSKVLAETQVTQNNEVNTKTSNSSALNTEINV